MIEFSIGLQNCSSSLTEIYSRYKSLESSFRVPVGTGLVRRLAGICLVGRCSKTMSSFCSISLM
jgi:hypothetical protein